ncbi:hypothetical protein AB0B07_33380 [Streptomyces sioyaensis]|uniref:hypothetical protein n=1 Tax=Streptomyces sioyaensis TaxID=67364 RepID=UPI0033EF74F7
MTQPITPERLAEIRAARYTDRSLSAADIDIDDLLGEIDRLTSWHDNYVKGSKFAGRDIRKRLIAAEAERDASGQHPSDF